MTKNVERGITYLGSSRLANTRSRLLEFHGTRGTLGAFENVCLLTGSESSVDMRVEGCVGGLAEIIVGADIFLDSLATVVNCQKQGSIAIFTNWGQGRRKNKKGGGP